MRRFPFTAKQVLCLCWGLFSFFFLIDFLMIFGSFWGAILRRFWSQKSIKMRLMSFWFLFIFKWFFNGFFVLEGSMFVFVRLFFRFVFCIDFWSILGSILESFWEALGFQMGHLWHHRKRLGLSEKRNGDLRVRSAEEYFRDLRLLSGRAMDERMKI